MLRRIQSFVQDDRNRWVARLECGHFLDVPSDAHPPAPEWSRTEHGRQNLVGSLLECPWCLSGLAERRPHQSLTQPDVTRRSWRSFWVRPKAPPVRIQPVWVDSRVACGAVLSIPDLERLVRLGFKSVLSLDQAGEPGQALSPHVEASWIRALAMTPHWVPVDPARILSEDVDRFVDTVSSVPGPVLVHSNGPERSSAFSTIWVGVTRGLNTSQALRAVADMDLSIDQRCKGLVDRELSRLLGGYESAHTASYSCYRFVDPPHVLHWDELPDPRRGAALKGADETPSRSTEPTYGLPLEVARPQRDPEGLQRKLAPLEA